jgi:hypothetical protein
MAATYDVFARKAHPDPLIYIGSVEVESAADVTRASLEKYGPETDWIEMLAAPHEKVIMVFSEHKEVEDERA